MTRILPFVLGVAALIAPAQAQKATQKPSTVRKALSKISIVLRTDADKRKLEDFLGDHERQVVGVDVFLSDEDMKDTRSDGEKSLNVPLTYKDKDGNTSGSEWIIDLKDGENDLVLNEKTGRLQAYVKVISIEGPQMGIMSIYSKPVAIEKAQK